MSDTAVAFSEPDLLLGGRLRLLQPEAGYRAAIDPLLLAAAVPAAEGARALDLGCGVGAAGLALLTRAPGIAVDGLEIDAEMARLAAENASLNGFADRFRVLLGDVQSPPRAVASAGYEQVLCNPPYLEAARADPPRLPARQRAEVEQLGKLSDWVAAALAFVRPGGHVTFVHRADRLPELLSSLQKGAGDIAVFPLWPRRERPAKRILVQARRGARGPARLLAGLVLHEADGSYSEAAEAVLRLGEALDLQGPQRIPEQQKQ